MVRDVKSITFIYLRNFLFFPIRNTKIFANLKMFPLIVNFMSTYMHKKTLYRHNLPLPMVCNQISIVRFIPDIG